jgi:hypothetical protein
MFLHLIVEVLLELFGTLKVFGVGRIVQATVGEDSLHVRLEKVLRHVISKRK